MPSIEGIKRKAQSAAYAATEMAQGAAAAAGEKAGEFKDYAGGRAGALKEFAGEKAALMSEKRLLSQNFRALGEWYAAVCGEEAPEAVADIVRAIRASQAKIAELRERGVTEDAEGKN